MRNLHKLLIVLISVAFMASGAMAQISEVSPGLIDQMEQNVKPEKPTLDELKIMEKDAQLMLNQSGFELMNSGKPGGSSPYVVDDEIIRYDDGVNNDAIGLTSGGTFQVAAYFPAATMGAYAGMKLNQIEIYINDLPSSVILKVYGQGTSTTPGDLLFEQTVTPTGVAWDLFDLTDQVDISGDDIWIGYELTHDGGLYPAGCDVGPHVPGGDWIETDGVWDELHVLAPTLDYNWNIAAYLVDGGPLLPNDIGVQTVSEPSSGADLTSAEPVTIIVKNYGTETQSSFDVSFTLDGGAAITESISTTLVGGDTYTHTFGTTVDLSTYGEYEIESCTDLTGDENLDNDCKTKMVENIAPSYCDATTGIEDEIIGHVVFGDIDNTTGWQGGVADYTDMSTLMVPGGSEVITVTNTGGIYVADMVTCWVDWNDNYEFEIGGDEEFILENVGGVGETFTGAIVAPATAAGGEHRIRVRLGYSTAPAPCGDASYGEVEDYTILIGGADFGHIVGNVVLDGVAPYDMGDVTEVAVMVGSNTVYPDASGNYDMEIYPGTYDVMATLYGYEVGMATGIVVPEGGNVTQDFTLPCIYTIVEGTVTAANGGAPIEGATVVAEGTGISATTMADGTYEIFIEAGVYNFTAGAPYFTYVTANLDLSAQTTTTQDFSLEDSEGVIVVIDLDPTPTGTDLVPIIQGMFSDGLVEYTTTIDGYPLDGSVQSVFLLLGIYSNNYSLTEDDATVITTWMDAYPDRGLYMEGGDTWAFDDPTTLHGYFNINPIADGAGDLVNADGIASYWAGNSWVYTGEVNWIDQLEAIAPAVNVIQNPDVGYFTAVAYDEGTYKTVGASHEIMGLTGGPGTTMAVACVMAHFGYAVFTYGSLEGYVTENLSGDPIEGATVNVGGLASVETDDMGYYFIEEVLVGAWEVTCSKENYSSSMAPVTIEEDVTATLDFMLVAPGNLDGMVTDANSGDPIEGAMIDVGGMYSAMTIADGSYMIENILVGTYDVTCTVTGYSVVVETDVAIAEGMTTTLDFELAAPEIVIDPMSIDIEIEPNAMADELVNIENPGNASLEWNAGLNILTDATDEIGDILLEMNVSTPAAETQMLGGEWDGTYFWTTGAGSAADPNKLYKFDVDGNLLETYDQPAASTSWGVRDLAWDGTYLYGGNESQFYQIDPSDGTFTLLFNQTWGTIRALAWVPTENAFYTKSFGDPLQKFDISGTLLEEITVPEAAAAYGAAWDDVNNLLYIFDQSGPSATHGTTFVEFDIATGAATGVTYLVPILTGSTEQIAGGAFFASDLISGKIVLGGVTQGTPDDMIFAMELGDFSTWISIDPNSGTLDPASDEDMTVHFDATDLLPGVYEAQIVFSTNPDVGSPVVDVTMTVVGLIPPVNLMADFDCTDVELMWEMPTGGDPDSWNVYRDDEMLDNVDVMMYTDMMVDPEMEYAYKVAAVYGDDESQPTAPTTIIVPVPEDLEPVNLEGFGNDPSSGYATLIWEAPEACLAPDSYSIYRTDEMIEENVTELTYTDGPLEPGVYQYEVVAVYYFGESGTSNAVYPVITTSIEDYDASSFQIFPNPANELVNVKSPVEITRIRVLNNMGQLVLDDEMNTMEYQINVSKYEAGIYFINLETSEGVIIRKVTVQ